MTKKIKKRAFIFQKALLPMIFTMLLLFSIGCITAYAHGQDERSNFRYDFPDGAAGVRIRHADKDILSGEAAIIDSVTYVPLRSFSEIFGAESIKWNENTRVATVKKYNMVANISEHKSYVEANGRYIALNSPVLNINNRLFVPVRTLSTLFSLDVEWVANTRTVVLNNTNRTFVSGDRFYNEKDLYWLSRIISAEAKGEPLLGKIAVGNVVLNRVRSNSYPNSVYAVVFDRKHGTQFSPVAYGTIYQSPTNESLIAAKICLEGFSLSDDILFFMNPKIASNNWISKNRPFAFAIGNHYFYK